jgi:hypothetical protein
VISIVEHDAGMEPRADQFAQAPEAAEVGRTDRACGFDLDPRESIPGLQDEVNLVAVIIAQMEESDALRTCSGLLTNFAEYERLKQLAERFSLLIELGSCTMPRTRRFRRCGDRGAAERLNLNLPTG